MLIEDIDRFESTEVFSNLRELNLVLNNSDLIEKHIVFIYAIKNEQFKTASDRTKFFDFIIPVIPVVNFETSAMEFIQSLEQNDSKIDVEGIDMKMVNSLFFIIDDIRVIYNISNELKTYYKVLEKDGFHDNENDSDTKLTLVNRLIPLLFYKNVEPFDFSCLLKLKGYLYDIIQCEDEIKNLRKETLLKKIDKTKEYIEDESNKSYQELNILKRQILIDVLRQIRVELMNSNFNLAVGNKIIRLHEIDHDHFNKILSDSTISYGSNINDIKQISKSKIEKAIGYNIDQKIEDFKNLKLIDDNKTKAEIQKINKKIEDLNKTRLSKLIDDKMIDTRLNSILDNEIYNHSQFKSSNPSDNKKKPNFVLIKSLILNGYINKDYFLYLSDFSKLGLSKNDFKFLLSIKNGQFLGFEYKIEDPNKIIERLSPHDYAADAILNLDFIHHIYKAPAKPTKPEFDYIAEKVSNFNKIETEFIIQYLELGTQIKGFVYALADASDYLWNHVKNDDTFSDDIRLLFYNHILKYAELDSILKYCENSDFKNYILNDKNFLEIRDIPTTINLIKRLNLKLHIINFDSKESLLRYIYENEAYKINKLNLDGFVKFQGIELDRNYNEHFLTLVDEKDELQGMKDYLYDDENIGNLIENIILNDPLNTKEAESIIIEILNLSDEIIDSDTKEAFFNQQEASIQDITKINNNDLRLVVVNSQRMEPTLKNILNVYKLIIEINSINKRNQSIESIMKLISRNDQVLVSYDNKQRIDLQKLVDLCITTNAIENELYRKFIETLENTLQKDDFEFEVKGNLEKDKFKILIEESYLDLSTDNVDFIIEEDHKELLPLFFKKYEKRLKDFFDNYQSPIRHEVGVAVLLSEIDDIIKTHLVNLFFNNEKRFFEFTAYRELLIKHLLITNGINYNKSILQEIGKMKFKAEHIPKIFNIIYSALNMPQIKNFFKNQNNKDYNNLSKHRKRPSFEITDANKKMLETLLYEEIISGYVKDLKKNKFKVKFVNQY